MTTPAEQRAIELHTALVCEQEAAARADTRPHFAATLRTWAANARRRAAAIDISPSQGSLFA